MRGLLRDYYFLFIQSSKTNIEILTLALHATASQQLWLGL